MTQTRPSTPVGGGEDSGRFQGPPLELSVEVTRLEGNTFTVPTPPAERVRLFGGQVAGQCLKAAGMTVEPGRLPHSLHAYFTRRGRGGIDMTIEVDESRDGRTFATRHVRAIQDGQPILEMMVSFQSHEEAADHQFVTMPDVPGPEELDTAPLPFTGDVFDIRPITPVTFRSLPPRIHPFWVQVKRPSIDDALEQRCILVYLSDMGIMGAAIIPGTSLSPGGVGSLDHAVWFHRSPEPGEWLLYTAEPVSNTSNRGYGRGSFFTRDGRLIASVAQEALLRPA